MSKIKKKTRDMGAVGRSHDDLSGGQWRNYEGNLECTNYESTNSSRGTQQMCTFPHWRPRRPNNEGGSGRE